MAARTGGLGTTALRFAPRVRMTKRITELAGTRSLTSICVYCGLFFYFFYSINGCSASCAHDCCSLNQFEPADHQEAALERHPD